MRIAHGQTCDASDCQHQPVLCNGLNVQVDTASDVKVWIGHSHQIMIDIFTRLQQGHSNRPHDGGGVITLARISICIMQMHGEAEY